MTQRASLLVRGISTLALVAGLFAGLVGVQSAVAAETLEVSAPTQLTSGPQYDRNPVFLRTAAGTDLLFFARSVDPCVRDGSCNPDSALYTAQVVTSTDGQTWSAPRQVAGRDAVTGAGTFYGRTVAAAQDGAGTIWVLWASGGNSNSLYVFRSDDDGATFAPAAQPRLDDQAYFNVEAVADASGTLWMFYEDGDGAPGVYARSWDGGAWSAPALVAAGLSIPKVIVDASGFHVVMVDGGSGTVYATRSADGVVWDAPAVVVAPAGSVTNWDPTIFKGADGVYNVFFAPDLGTGPQRIAWARSADGMTWSGASSTVTAGGYAAATWWDYWPEGGNVNGQDTLFYTSEKDGAQQGSGHIMQLPLTWDQARNHLDAIQPAVDMASAGDTVHVGAGAYTEDVTIAKPLTLLGAQAGVDARTRSGGLETVLNGPDHSFTISAGHVTIDGFTVQDAALNGSSFGIYALGGAGNRFLNNILRNNTMGIYFSNDGSAQAVFRHNLFDHNNQNGDSGGAGIFGGSGPVSNVLIEENMFLGHTSSGVVIVPSVATDITIARNTSVGDSSAVALFSTSNVTISDNTVTGATGSALYIGGATDNVSVTGNAITGGVASAVRVANDFGNGPNQRLQVLGNTLAHNAYGIRLNAGAYSGELEFHFNRIVGNATHGVSNDEPTATLDAENNWWGCNTGPNTAGCDTTSGNVDADPWLTLAINAPAVVAPGVAATVVADVTHNSAGADTSGQGHLPDGTPVTFGATGGTITPAATTVNGRASATFVAGPAAGAASVSATLDNATATATFPIGLTIRVSDISLSAVAGKHGARSLNATVTLAVSPGGQPAGAKVTVQLTAPGGATQTQTATANASGAVTFTWAAPSAGTYTVTVLNVTRPNHVYDAANNTETSDTITLP